MIIPTIYSRPDLLNKARNAVLETGARVVVADNPDWSFAENCNDGARYARGDIYVFLNDDTEPQPGWLDAILAEFDDPEVGIVGCRLVYPDGRIQHAGVGFRRAGGMLEAYNILTDEPARDVEAVTGACLAIRRELFEDLGGFDAGYRNGYEDVDLCLRADSRIRYTDKATVIHHESQSGAARWSHVRENILRLQEQHGDYQCV